MKFLKVALFEIFLLTSISNTLVQASEQKHKPASKGKIQHCIKSRTWEMHSRLGWWWDQQITSQKKIMDLDENYRRPEYISVLGDAGKGVNVYILDSGIRISHKGFAGRATNFKNMTDTSYVPGESMEDFWGHGTHVAGIVGRERWGVAQSANLINVKVLNKQGRSEGKDQYRFVEAVRDVTEEHLANLKNPPFGWRGSVINLSLTKHADFDGLSDALEDAYKAGIPIAAAAGNHAEWSFQADDEVPCKYPSVLCVGSIDKEYYVDWFSEEGNPARIYAPGHNITSLSNTGDTDKKQLMGTSMAAPFVAGFMATIVGYEGLNNNASEVYERILANSVSGIMRETSDRKHLGGPLRLLNIGINNPKRGMDPYKIPPGKNNCPDEGGPTATITMASVRESPPSARNMGSEETEPEVADIIIMSSVTMSPLPTPTESTLQLTTFLKFITAASPAIDNMPTPCIGNQVGAYSCVPGMLPSATPFGGTVPPSCYKADGNLDTFRRINAAEASKAASDYCSSLVNNKVVLSSKSTTVKNWIRKGAAENNSDMILNVVFNLNYCPLNEVHKSSVLDFKALGKEYCWENFYHAISTVCVQDATWDDYNPKFTIQGGVFGKDCGMWSMSSARGKYKKESN